MSKKQSTSKKTAPTITGEVSYHVEPNFAGDAKPVGEVPDFRYFKAIRAQDLSSYRQVVRSLVMRYGEVLPRTQRRLLEDLQVECAISDERAGLELEEALKDPLVIGVKRSGVWAKSQEAGDANNWSDVANDYPPIFESNLAQDNGTTVVGTKNDGTAAGTTAAKNRSTVKFADSELTAAQIRGEEIEKIENAQKIAANHLTHCLDPYRPRADQPEQVAEYNRKKESLVEMKKQLQALKQEAQAQLDATLSAQ